MCFEFIAELAIKGGEFSENKITKKHDSGEAKKN